MTICGAFSNSEETLRLKAATTRLGASSPGIRPFHGGRAIDSPVHAPMYRKRALTFGPCRATTGACDTVCSRGTADELGVTEAVNRMRTYFALLIFP